jgi:AcrR family transcriptional regulator
MPQKVTTAPRKEPRQKRSREKVAAILDAAARVLVDEGYERATTNRVAEVAGISIGSLYQYFPNKESLVAALAERHSEAMCRVYTKKAELLLNAPLAVAAEDLVRTNLEVHAADARLHKVLMEEVPRVGALEAVEAIDRKISAVMRGYLEARKDEIAPKDLDVATFVLVKLVQVLAHRAVVERPEYLEDDRLIKETTAAVLGYLLHSPSQRVDSALDHVLHAAVDVG